MEYPLRRNYTKYSQLSPNYDDYQIKKHEAKQDTR